MQLPSAIFLAFPLLRFSLSVTGGGGGGGASSSTSANLTDSRFILLARATSLKNSGGRCWQYEEIVKNWRIYLHTFKFLTG
jgi:hypothetical protein